MRKSRLEAFCDGIFAIVITLLILEIKLPLNLPADQLLDGLYALAPKMSAYLLSFCIIALYWTIHHMYLDRIKKVNGTLLLLNFMTLLMISFMPFPTILLGAYPFQPIPLMIYGLILVISNLLGFLILLYLCKHPEYLIHGNGKALFQQQKPIYIWVNTSYGIAMGLAFFYPKVSYAIYIVVLFLVSVNLLKRINQEAKAME